VLALEVLALAMREVLALAVREVLALIELLVSLRSQGLLEVCWSQLVATFVLDDEAPHTIAKV
jgi:hypothetical protein